jgi:S-adenosylmethionine:tRNA ribosyltransferase-isomerase
MRRADFHYELPPELIAQAPLAERSASRLLTLDGATGALTDRHFADLPTLLRPDDLLVFNDTRVVAARLFGTKPSGGRVEVFLERATGPDRAWVRDPLGFFEAHGSVPLPPYIARNAAAADRERYQSIFAREPGAVAAPTASLHFDAPLVARIDALGVRRAVVTLHVGAGTFQPLRVEEVSRHVMHAERYTVSPALVRAVTETRAAGGRVVAVGTTVARALEAAAAGGALAADHGETRLFITPGYAFRVVDALITNFHLPESTLLMLVAAHAGLGNVLAAYRHAVQERYRFFSYGDAMWITPAPGARR